MAAFFGAKKEIAVQNHGSTLLRAGLAISLTVFKVGFPLPLASGRLE
jgi:hypothetical protein